MQTFADPLQRAVQVAGERRALISEGQTFSHRQLQSRCRRLAAVLKAKGAEPGDRIAILAANSHHFIESYLAIPAAGFVIVPLNTRHAEPELRYALEDAGATILLSDRDPGSLREIVDTVIMIPDEYDSLLEGHGGFIGRTVLYRRHDGRIQGRHADAPQPDLEHLSLHDHGAADER